MPRSEARLAQVAENQRFYGDLRFKQLTLLMGGMTALGAGVAQYPALKVPLAISGALFTRVMWVMEVRSTLFHIAIVVEAPELYPPRLASLFSWVNTTSSLFFLHLASYALWALCAVRWSGNYWVEALGLGLGAFLVAFSLGNYWAVRKHVWAGQPRGAGAR
jgi:hypothetical protein